MTRNDKREVTLERLNRIVEELYYLKNDDCNGLYTSERNKLDTIGGDLENLASAIADLMKGGTL